MVGSQKLPPISGQEMVKLLKKEGFYIFKTRGSHVNLTHPDFAGEDCWVTVPLHNALKKGTLTSILKQARISREEFLQLHRNRKKR